MLSKYPIILQFRPSCSTAKILGLTCFFKYRLVWALIQLVGAFMVTLFLNIQTEGGWSGAYLVVSSRAIYSEDTFSILMGLITSMILQTSCSVAMKPPPKTSCKAILPNSTLINGSSFISSSTAITRTRRRRDMRPTSTSRKPTVKKYIP